MRITYKQIMSFNPCYDPKECDLPEDYDASLIDFIKVYRTKVKNSHDILWVVLRPDFFNDRDLRLFAVWAARQVQHLMSDQRSLDALDITEKFAFGESGAAAWEAAGAAAGTAAGAAAGRAAWETAEIAAGEAARAAAWAAGRPAAWEAAGAAAGRAARETGRAAAWAAAGEAAVAWIAAGEAAWEAQIDMILKMIEEPNGKWFKRKEIK